MKLNPFARVEAIRGSSGEIHGLRLVAPVKGRGLQTTSLSRSVDGEAFAARRKTVLSALFDAQCGRDPWAALSDPERDFLERTGLFVADANVPIDVTFDPAALAPTAIPPDRLELLNNDLSRHGTALH